MSSDENKFRLLFIVGTLIGAVGALGLSIGLFLPFKIWPDLTDHPPESGIFQVIPSGVGYEKVPNIIGFLILGLAIAILIICLISFIGAITPYGFNINDERPSLIALTAFIFAPTVVVTQYVTPMYFLLTQGTELLDDIKSGVIPTVATGLGFYVNLISTALIFVSFFILALIFLWKHLPGDLASELSLQQPSESRVPKVLRITSSALAIIAGVCIILGVVFPAYTWNDDSVSSGLLLSEDKSNLDLEALFFMLLITMIIIVAILIILSNLGVLKTTKSELPLLGFILIPLILPGFTPFSAVKIIWTTPILELVFFCNGIFTDINKTISFFGWMLVAGLIALTVVFFLGLTSYFFSKTASSTLRPPSGRRMRRSKLPTGPPSAPPLEQTTDAVLTGEAMSGPPTAPLSGPPTATGREPVVTSAPPSPPSFLATTKTSGSPSARETPTCPFCGKSLRFIEEYQRWYCDSCQQYV